MIPKIIHCCWFGPSPKPPIVLKCMASWADVLNGWAIKEYNSGPDHKFLNRALEAGKWSTASNYMRLLKLRDEGGVYLDTDMEVLKSLDPLLNDKMFFGWESKDWCAAGIIGAEPSHPGIQTLLKRLLFLDPATARNPYLPSMLTVWVRVKNSGEIQRYPEFTTYPEEYFYPVYPSAKRDNITENSYTNHHWMKSW